MPERYLLKPEEIAVIRARCEGTSVITTMDSIDKADAQPNRLALIEKARELYAYRSSDDIEIDDDANLSPNDIGCWVQGWLFVHNEEME